MEPQILFMEVKKGRRKFTNHIHRGWVVWVSIANIDCEVVKIGHFCIVWTRDQGFICRALAWNFLGHIPSQLCPLQNIATEPRPHYQQLSVSKTTVAGNRLSVAYITHSLRSVGLHKSAWIILCNFNSIIFCGKGLTLRWYLCGLEFKLCEISVILSLWFMVNL